jgi:hypothetical protein
MSGWWLSGVALQSHLRFSMLAELPTSEGKVMKAFTGNLLMVAA